MVKGDPFSDVTHWGRWLRESIGQNACGNDYLVSILDKFDCTTASGIKDLSSFAISELQNNLTLAPQEASSLWQVSQCLKKFRYGCTASPEEMMKGWIERNARCASKLELPIWVLDAMKTLLAPLGPAFDATDGQGRFGNGAVEEGLSPHARWNTIDTFPYNVRDPEDLRWWVPDSPCRPARLCCVPKDMFKLRSITVEPAEATFLQQYYRTRLIAAAAKVLPYSSAIPQQAWGAGPEVQRDRALRGSLTGNLATLDLSDASDSVRWDVVSYVFPATVVAGLEKARSTHTDVLGVTYRNHMFAGMGNATTFVVESLYFWALLTVLAHWLRDKVPVSVFGDDIIVSTQLANHPLFQEYLASAGLTLNMAKSGLSPQPGFREACGLVAYQGHELPLLRINGYRVNEPEELVALCSLISEGLAPDSRYAPFVKGLMTIVGRELRQTMTLPLVPLPLQEAGRYLVDPDMRIGEWSYRAQWDPRLQHPLVKVQVAVPRRGKTRAYTHCTNGEALGILNGQLHTAFHGTPAGTKASRKTIFKYPAKGFEWRCKWIPCWGSGPELVELSTR